MPICKNCVNDSDIEFCENCINDAKPGAGTVVGTLIGCIAGLATGTISLVPLGLISGLAFYISPHCDECGGDIEDLYEPMVEEEDGLGRTIYRSILDPLRGLTKTKGYDSDKFYVYSEVNNRFELIQDTDGFDGFDLNMGPDSNVEISYDFEIGDSGFGDSAFDGGDSGSGEGGGI